MSNPACEPIEKQLLLTNGRSIKERQEIQESEPRDKRKVDFAHDPLLLGRGKRADPFLLFSIFADTTGRGGLLLVVVVGSSTMVLAERGGVDDRVSTTVLPRIGLLEGVGHGVLLFHLPFHFSAGGMWII